MPKSNGPILDVPTRPTANQPQSYSKVPIDPKDTAPAVHVAGHIISAGAPMTTINDKAIAYDGTVLHIDEAAISLPKTGDRIVSTKIVANGFTVLVGPSTEQGNHLPKLVFEETAPAPTVYVAGQIVSAGAPTTIIDDKAVAYDGVILHIDGAAVALPKNGHQMVPTSIVADGLPVSVVPAARQDNHLPTLIVDGSAVLVNEASRILFSDQTLTGGDTPVTEPGKASLPYGHDGSPTDAVVGTRAESWHIGSLIMDGFGDQSPTSMITINGITISEGANAVVISGTSYSLGHGVSPSSIVIGSQTLILGPDGVKAPDAPSTITSNGLKYTVDASRAIISGTTYSLGHGASKTSVVIGFQTLLIGPSRVQIESTASLVTFDGLILSVDASQAVISGTTYALDKADSSSTLVIGGKTYILGPNGISAEPTLSPITINGLTFSMDASEAVISGTTFDVGPDASPTIVTLGNQTASAGPGGIAFPSTTLVPPNPTGTSFESFTGIASTSSLARSSILDASLLCLLVAIAIM